MVAGILSFRQTARLVAARGTRSPKSSHPAYPCHGRRRHRAPLVRRDDSQNASLPGPSWIVRIPLVIPLPRAFPLSRALNFGRFGSDLALHRRCPRPLDFITLTRGPVIGAFWEAISAPCGLTARLSACCLTKLLADDESSQHDRPLHKMIRHGMSCVSLQCSRISGSHTWTSKYRSSLSLFRAYTSAISWI